MATYQVDSQKSKLSVIAHSGIHDTTIIWQGFSGSIDTTLDSLPSTQIGLEVDMRTADAGDWLKNKKLRKELNYDRYPLAKFSLHSISDIKEVGEEIELKAKGLLSWREKEVALVIHCQGKVSENELTALGTFELNMKDLGIKPPRILMLKVDEVVRCQVYIVAKR